MNESPSPITSKGGPRPSDKWIPWYLAAFFIVMISVLIPMGYFAVHTMPGVVTDNAYEKGLAYNKAIAAGGAQAALGWKGQITLDVIGTSSSAKIGYTLHDATGNTIDDAVVHAWLVRPSVGGMDRDVALAAQGKGIYTNTVDLPAHGLWDLRVSATRKDQNFQTNQRVVVP